MDNRIKLIGFIFVLALAACSSSSTNAAQPGLGGSAGSGPGGTGGAAGTDPDGGVAGQPAGGAAGSSAGGSTGGVGSTGGTGGTPTGGTGGTPTGGTGGTPTGGTGGTPTGGTGGTPTGGTGGTGGSPCVEYSYSEVVQLCQGNCGTLEHKCDPGTYNCLQYVPANACGSQQWCVLKADGSGACGGCTRRPAYDGMMSLPRPFDWACPGVSYDNIQDDSETDIDCGGPHNPHKCSAGKCNVSAHWCTAGKIGSCNADGDCTQFCSANSDCELQTCVGGKCANSTKQPTGCDKIGVLATGESEFRCPNSQNGCVRAPTGDYAVTAAYCTSSSPYAMQCPAGQSLASVGCVSSNGLWCCSGTFL